MVTDINSKETQNIATLFHDGNTTLKIARNVEQ